MDILTLAMAKATRWNDLKDKPFYSEMSEIDFIPATDVEYGPLDGDAAVIYCNICEVNAPLVVGQTYTVIWNGQVYECVAKVVPGDDWIYMGNDWIWWETDEVVDNGVPFVIDVRDDGDGKYMAEFGTYRPSAETTVNVCVKTTAEDIHTIDPKYLPCDLMFKVNCTRDGHPKYTPISMTKPTIVSGSLETVLEKMANGEIPVVKVQYMCAWDKKYSYANAYGGEFTCETWLYGTSVLFCHNIPDCTAKIDVQIAMDIDDPDFMEMKWCLYETNASSFVIS